ncbi:STAS domain-containing protein [Lentzea sp.]|uniref:STAS domain-containing protein n=1 Tax=Lentzea sp. TaxID=56099 RepID=UPI002CD05AFC|nr:STAS domain-containing protein [Lentzea sp.]HUQ55047.1 STAS domain-containing protein [Lentzea sp.]
MPRIEEDPSVPLIRVTGPADARTAARFGQTVTIAGATGTRSLTVDLGDVTQLAGAGVSVLHRLTARHRDNRTELLLVAGAGTAADVVMTLAGLGHATGHG